MKSPLLSYIGIDFIDPAYYIIGLLVLVLILFILYIQTLISVKKLRKTYEKFMTGKNAKSLEQEITGLFEDINFPKMSNEENKAKIGKISDNLMVTYQKMGLVHYDAYKEMGGKLSFCVALLNKENNGFLLNSIHSSDGCYIYTKSIKDGNCKVALGNEEKKALEKALGTIIETDKTKKGSHEELIDESLFDTDEE